MLGGGVSHPSQLTTGLVIKSVTTSPTLAGERMLFILQVSILSEQTKNSNAYGSTHPCMTKIDPREFEVEEPLMQSYYESYTI